MTALGASPLWNTARCHWTQATDEMNMASPTKLALTVLALSMLVLSGCADLAHTRYGQPARAQISTVGDLWLRGGRGNDLCRVT